MTYAAVNGLQLYYEIRGTGRPLVLLHGGLMTIDLKLLPDAQLAVLPGTTHIGVTRRPGEVLALIAPFLDARRETP